MGSADPLPGLRGAIPSPGPCDYDWVGHHLNPPADPNPMVYNEGDQLVRWPGMYRYSYDGAGNLVEVKNDLQTQVLKSYTYTPAGLLATATYKDKDGNDRTLVNTWDANSNRVSFNANGTEYELVYDITASIPAVIEESTSGSTTYYIREPSGALIARLSATDGIRYYHFDELGSTGLLTDANGNITDRYTYDAYGSLLSHDCYSGSVTQPYQYVGQLGYYTHWMEPEFGLLQLGVRFYDPEVGRFTQRDPPQNDYAPYVYAENEPTRLVDPEGTFAWGPVLIGVVGTVVVVDMRCARDAFLVGADWQDKAKDPAFRKKWKGDTAKRAHFMAHCMAACLVTRCLPGCLRSTLGRAQAQGLGLATELFQALLNLIENIRHRQWNPLNDAWAPALKINEIGAVCGLSNGTCYDCCNKKYDTRYRKE